MTGATDLCAKVVTTLGSGLRRSAMVTIVALLGVASLLALPLTTPPAAQASPISGVVMSSGGINGTSFMASQPANTILTTQKKIMS